MKRLIIILISLVNTGLFAQTNYDASAIPKELLPYASAVIRNEEITVDVKSPDDVITTTKQAITVLNRNGDEMAHIVIEHDKSNVIKYVKGAVFNSFGKQTAKFSESNFDDVSAGNDFSLFEDVRVKHYLPSVTEYPYTIEYECQTRSKQTLNFDQWSPNTDPGIAVMSGTYTLKCKPGFNISYNEINYTGHVKKGTTAEGLTSYEWHAVNMKAIKAEPFSPNSRLRLTSVQVIPEKFIYYGISGAYKNWKELGKWQYDKLLVNRQNLNPETVDFVRQLTKGIESPKLKAKKIYEYMQGKTHYVSVQVGIGGYQPFLASDVDQQDYGDCKALVNYTQALLKAVNIDSYYCVVEAGRENKVSMLNNFASMAQGNHIILCLPFKNDTTWADCTSQTIPFGYLGPFTDDRTVLACTPEGGKLMHTPKYTYSDNIEKKEAEFDIKDNGELTGNINTIFKGADYEDREYVISEPLNEQQKMLKHIYPLDNMNIDKLKFIQDKSFDPVTKEEVKIHAPEFAALENGKCNFMINPVNRMLDVPKTVINRKNDVYINRGYTEEDEIAYNLPASYRFEKEPLNVSINKPFGRFTATIKLEGNKVLYKRKVELIDGTYSKETYADLVDFFQEIVLADGYNVILVKNN